MPRLASQRSVRPEFLGVAVAIAVLAGCAGNPGMVPNQTILASRSASTSLGLGDIVPDVSTPPKCKGQKNTSEYAKAATQHLKANGGSLCVPEFGGWGGALQYPKTYGSYDGYTVNLIGSTKAYKGALLPPAGATPPIYYLQVGFNSFPGFYPTLPKGNPLVSSHLTPKKSYTLELFIYFYGLGWDEENSCYQVAEKSKYGGSLADVGALFEKVTFLEKNGAIEIFKGQLVSTQC
jgi:hypothetical protein